MSLTDEIEKLEHLRRAGTLTDEEFERAKSTLIGKAKRKSGAKSRSEFRTWATLLHISQLVGHVIPGGFIIAPILIWQLKKEEFPEIERHGRIVVNWLISCLVYTVVGVGLAFVIVGIPLLIALVICGFIFPIIGAVKANEGKYWRYPLTIQFIAEPEESIGHSDLPPSD